MKGGVGGNLSKRLKLQGMPNLVQAVSHGAVGQTTVWGFKSRVCFGAHREEKTV